jgi:hypothetical protein
VKDNEIPAIQFASAAGSQSHNFPNGLKPEAEGLAVEISKPSRVELHAKQQYPFTSLTSRDLFVITHKNSINVPDQQVFVHHHPNENSVSIHVPDQLGALSPVMKRLAKLSGVDVNSGGYNGEVSGYSFQYDY